MMTTSMRQVLASYVIEWVKADCKQKGRQSAGGKCAHRRQVALCAPAGPRTSTQGSVSTKPIPTAVPTAEGARGCVVTCMKVLMTGHAKTRAMHSEQQCDHFHRCGGNTGNVAHTLLRQNEPLRHAAPGMHLRWQGMHASYLWARGAAQGIGNLLMLHHTVHHCAGRACMQGTYAEAGGHRSGGAQKLGGAPQGVGDLPMLHHFGQPHILQMYFN